VTNEATVLVVDDEDLLRNALVFQFKREGFNVMSASNGKEAFEIIKKNKIDAVISDVQMPGGNGIDLLKDVKNYDAEIPVLVFITAFADLTDAEAYDLGADAIFTKPFDRKVLVKCIKDAISPTGRDWNNNPDEVMSQKEISGEYKISPGRGGVFVAMDSPQFVVGSIINLALKTNLEGFETYLKGKACVRWVRLDVSKGPIGVGLEFIHLEEEGLAVYKNWLETHKVKPFIPIS
jgi:CheY-like chemotaxis protein